MLARAMVSSGPTPAVDTASVDVTAAVLGARCRVVFVFVGLVALMRVAACRIRWGVI